MNHFFLKKGVIELCGIKLNVRFVKYLQHISMLSALSSPSVGPKSRFMEANGYVKGLLNILWY